MDLVEHLERIRAHHHQLKEFLEIMTTLSDEVAATITLMEAAATEVAQLASDKTAAEAQIATLQAQVDAQATQISDEATEVTNLTAANTALQAALDQATAGSTPPAGGGGTPAPVPSAVAFADTPVQLSAGLGISASVAGGASGGTAPYTFANPAGDMPAGVTMDANGNLSGNAPAAGSYPFTVEVTDSTGAKGTGTETVTVV